MEPRVKPLFTLKRMMNIMKMMSVKLVFALALGIFAGYAPANAMENNQETQPNNVALPNTYRSQKVEVNTLIDQDEVKNFAYQAKGYAKKAITQCPCEECGCYAKNAKLLWQAVRNEKDTSSEKVKQLIERFSTHDHVAMRLPKELTSWLEFKGYQTLKAEELDKVIMEKLAKEILVLSLLGALSLQNDESGDESENETLQPETENN